MTTLYPILILIAFLGLIYLFLHLQNKKSRRKKDNERFKRGRR